MTNLRSTLKLVHVAGLEASQNRRGPIDDINDPRDDERVCFTRYVVISERQIGIPPSVKLSRKERRLTLPRVAAPHGFHVQQSAAPWLRPKPSEGDRTEP